MRYLLYPFDGWLTQYRKFRSVTCPNCGQEELDSSIRFLGVFPPAAIFYFLAIGVAIAVIEAIHDAMR